MACSSSESNIEPTETHVQDPKTVTQITEPLNCPSIIEAKTFEKRRTHGQVWLHFQIKKNSNFDTTLGDACKGDMKNLWQDLKRHSLLIEEHSPHLSHISGLLGYNLDDFPITKAEVRRYVDDAAKTAQLRKKLNLHDRSTLEGGMEIQRFSRSFLMQTLQDYLEQEHKHIIENILHKTSSKMDEYGGEKLQYCNNIISRCEYLSINAEGNRDNTFEFNFIGVGIDAWTFEHDKQIKSE